VEHSPIPFIDDNAIPQSREPAFQHAIDTYASETNKMLSVWQNFTDAELAFRPWEKSSPVQKILEHQLLSERRFFSEFLGVPEVPAAEVLPVQLTVQAFIDRAYQFAMPRLQFMAAQEMNWWLEVVPFFEVQRQRAWIFWRRVLHTAHHRTQLTVYLRPLGKDVPSVYGPTADVSWAGADPTTSVEAAGRKSGQKPA
jgi:uncharacterized damage-inducible protein DinB